VDQFGAGGKSILEGFQEAEAWAMPSQQSTAGCALQEAGRATENSGDVQVDCNTKLGEIPQSDEHDYSELTCRNGEFTAEELQQCIQALERGKACGLDGVMAEMIIDGGEALHQCLLNMYNRMLEGAFPASLSVDLITAVFKSTSLTVIQIP
jgi:hypothetical protein